jgi:hypothetical protein
VENMENKYTDSKGEENRPPELNIRDHMMSMEFDTEFEATENGIVSLKSLKVFQSYEIKSVQLYRSNEESNSMKSSVVCIIEANNGEKGILVDGCSSHGNSKVSHSENKEPEIKK